MLGNPSTVLLEKISHFAAKAFGVCTGSPQTLGASDNLLPMFELLFVHSMVREQCLDLSGKVAVEVLQSRPLRRMLETRVCKHRVMQIWWCFKNIAPWLDQKGCFNLLCGLKLPSLSDSASVQIIFYTKKKVWTCFHEDTRWVSGIGWWPINGEIIKPPILDRDASFLLRVGEINMQNWQY